MYVDLKDTFLFVQAAVCTEIQYICSHNEQMFLLVQSGLKTMLVSLVDFCKSNFVKQGRSISTLLGTYVGGRKISTLLVLRLGT